MIPGREEGPSDPTCLRCPKAEVDSLEGISHLASDRNDRMDEMVVVTVEAEAADLVEISNNKAQSRG